MPQRRTRKTKMDDHITDVVRRIKRAITQPDYAKQEKSLKKELEAALADSDLTEEQLYTSYIRPLLEQTTGQLSQSVSEIRTIVDRMRNKGEISDAQVVFFRELEIPTESRLRS